MRTYSVSRLMKLFVPSVALLASVTAVAQQAGAGPPDKGAAEVALSNDTIQLRYYDHIDSNERRLWGGGFLGEERDIVLNAGLLWPVELGQRFDVALGPNLIAALLSDENQDIMAVSIGGEARFFFDSSRRFAIAGAAYYAPDILTFGSADNIVDLWARAELKFSDRVIGYAGMRWFEFDLIDGSGERTLQEEVFVGVRYRL